MQIKVVSMQSSDIHKNGWRPSNTGTDQYKFLFWGCNGLKPLSGHVPPDLPVIFSMLAITRGKLIQRTMLALIVPAVLVGYFSEIEWFYYLSTAESNRTAVSKQVAWTRDSGFLLSIPAKQNEFDATARRMQNITIEIIKSNELSHSINVTVTPANDKNSNTTSPRVQNIEVGVIENKDMLNFIPQSDQARPENNTQLDNSFENVQNIEVQATQKEDQFNNTQSDNSFENVQNIEGQATQREDQFNNTQSDNSFENVQNIEGQATQKEDQLNYLPHSNDTTSIQISKQTLNSDNAGSINISKQLPIPAACVVPESPLTARKTRPGGQELTFKPGGKSRLVYDLFSFNNELSTLEMRMIELEDVVDFFVIIEMPYTLTGIPKPLYFQENRMRFAKYLKKVILVTGNETGNKNAGAWGRERFYHLLGLNAVKDIPSDAIVFFSDVDEIISCWTAYTLKTADNFPNDTYVHLNMPYSYYNFRWRGYKPFSNARAFLRSYMDVFPGSLLHLFSDRIHVHWDVQKTGWHCSYCFSIETIVLKLQSFSHQEYNRPPYTEYEHIKRHIEHGLDLFDRPGKSFELAVTQPSLPFALLAFPERFGPMYLPPVVNGSVPYLNGTDLG